MVYKGKLKDFSAGRVTDPSGSQPVDYACRYLVLRSSYSWFRDCSPFPLPDGVEVNWMIPYTVYA
jgi:hypothetical protein